MRGELLGLLGKELRNSRNNIWLNYALPADELMGAVEAIKSGQTQPDKARPKLRNRIIRLRLPIWD